MLIVADKTDFFNIRDKDSITDLNTCLAGMALKPGGKGRVE